MINNLNNREKQSKNIQITVGKKGDQYYYISDSLTERSKIKIPITAVNKKETKNNIGASQETDFKSDKYNKNTNGVHHHNTQSQDNSTSTTKQNESLLKDHEDIPVLTKIVENNLKQHIIIPSCSQWFKFDDIHEIEQKALPEFFCGKFPAKTPEVYKDYRNYIINLYRENLNTYLTATSNISLT
jgi:hypothetical protein